MESKKTTLQNLARNIWVQLVVATLFVAGITLYTEKHTVSTVSEAGTKEKTVNISLYPKDTTAPIGSEANVTALLVSQNKNVAYIKLTLSFDRNKFAFTGTENTRVDSRFDIISVSDAETANKTGDVTVIYGATDANGSNGSIQLSQFVFSVKSEGGTISTNPAKSQIIFSGTKPEQAELSIEEAFIKTGTKKPSPSVAPSNSPVQPSTSPPPTSVSPTTTNTPSPSPAVTSPSVSATGSLIPTTEPIPVSPVQTQ